MADSSTQSMVMKASPESIMSVIADFEAYPEWTGAVKKVEITQAGTPGRAKRVKFTLQASLISDIYELAYTWRPDGRSVSWDLVSAQMQKAQHGSYTLEPLDQRTKVTYTLSVQLTIPLIGPIRRRAERTIMETALGELRKRVENA